MQANQGALAASEQLAHASAEIASIVEAVGRVGWTLSLTGLNASVMAAHTGNQGVVFSTLTQALTRLADESAREARALQSSATDLANKGNEQASCQSANAEEHRLALDGAEDLLRKASEGITDSVVAISATINDARTRSRSAVTTITRIMGAVQREDILRQKIDHLLMVLDELRAEIAKCPLREQPLDAVAFIEQSAHLSANLWNEIRDDVVYLVNDILESLEQLRPAVELSELGLESVEALRSRALAPMRELQQRLVSLGSAPQCALSESTGALEQGIENVKTSLEEIHGYTRQLAVFHVMVRIEVARTPALAPAGTIAAQIAAATKQLSDLLAKSFRANASLDAQLKRMQDTSKELERRDATISELHAATEQKTIALDAAGDALSDYIQYVRSLGIELRKSIGIFERDIQRFLILARKSDAAMRTAARIQEEATQLVAAHAGEGSTPVSSRMLELVDRFTVLSHKTIAAEIVDINVESGDPAGELTLF
jgi:hypothetical protein